MRAAGEFEAMPKKEALLLTRELEKLQKNLGGIRGMNRRPDAVFILDTKKEQIGITEANLSLIRSGKVKGVRFETLGKLCEALDCKPGDLLDFDVVTSPNP